MEQINFDRLDRAIVRELQGDIPLVPEPFAEVAAKVGCSHDEVLNRVTRMVENGAIRRFGATVRHQRVGFKANCMVVWLVPDGNQDEIGKLFASFPEITHCYHRPPFEGWPYTLYTMIHGSSQADIDALIERMKEKSGIADCRRLTSLKEWKKTSMKYFADAGVEDDE